MDHIAGIAVTPQQERRSSRLLRIPTEQFRPIGSLKPDILQRHAAGGGPIALFPRLRMIDKELIEQTHGSLEPQPNPCLLYTSDAADERSSVDLGGRRIIKKKNINCDIH